MGVVKSDRTRVVHLLPRQQDVQSSYEKEKYGGEKGCTGQPAVWGKKMCCGRQLHQAEEGLVHAWVNSHSMHVEGHPMCVGQLRLRLVSVHVSGTSLLSPAAGNQLPAPPAISLSHARSWNGVLQSRFVIIGTHQSKVWDWNWTIADELPTRAIRAYALICAPAPLISERGIMTRHQDPCGGAGIRSHVCARGQMGMTPL